MSSTFVAKDHPNQWADKPTKSIDEMGTYLAWIPDFEEGSKRLQVRDQHLQNSKLGHANGWIIKAGAIFSNDPVATGEKPKMVGSWYVMREESLEKAKERLSKDVYVAGGAWDLSRATYTAVAVSKHD
ncbi:hypothetical protein T439DRAFT_328571 [Meredithblackwellia eburnea MCA 4105]